MDERLTLWAIPPLPQRRVPFTPTQDSSVSLRARVLWQACKESAARSVPVIVPALALGCDEAEAMAAVHELVAFGWMAVRWSTDLSGVAMVLEWPAHAINTQREMATWDEGS